MKTTPQPKVIKKTGFRPYMAKINIESDELQTSSTDLGDSSDRSENTEKNSEDELYNSHKLKRTKEREARRQKRLNTLQEPGKPN